MKNYKRTKEYVASLIGLYKNNGEVSCVDNYFHTQVHPGVSQGVTCNLRKYTGNSSLIHQETEIIYNLIPHCM